MSKKKSSTTDMVPEVDVKTGSMINPHNPEFITKRPWYLGDADGPTLDHQGDQRQEEDKIEYSLAKAEELVQKERKLNVESMRKNKWRVGMWVEALKRGRKPYMICQIVKIANKGSVFDLKYEDGTMEKDVKMQKSKRGTTNARIRVTNTGSRSFAVNVAQYGKETYDSKRDAYHGLEVSKGYMERQQEKYSQRDAIRRKIRSEHKSPNTTTTTSSSSNKNKKDKESNGHDDDDDNKESSQPSDSDSDSDLDSDDDGSDSDDEFVQRDEDAKVHTSRLARQGGVGGQQMKVTARNLRIREDTAKYLRNLDINSAFYDPKSRSMRDNPNPEIDPTESQFAGDNFSRISGDAVGLAQTQVFAWDAEKDGGVVTTTTTTTSTGGDATADAAVGVIHPQANPSQAELSRKKYTSKEAEQKSKQKKQVLQKYGGAEYLDGDGGLAAADETELTQQKERDSERQAQERKARFGVSVQEEHYTRDGRSVKGSSNKKMIDLKSKYEEDVYLYGHAAVWGSYFHKGAMRWGYSDDHSLLRNSYGTGANGRIVNDEANELKYGTGVAGSKQLAQARELLKAIPQNKRNAMSSQQQLASGSKMYGEADQFAQMDKTKVLEALKKQEKENNEVDDRKRKYNSMTAQSEVTEEEMEAFRLKKERADDPMARIQNSEGLLEYK